MITAEQNIPKRNKRKHTTHKSACFTIIQLMISITHKYLINLYLTFNINRLFCQYKQKYPFKWVFILCTGGENPLLSNSESGHSRLLAPFDSLSLLKKKKRSDEHFFFFMHGWRESNSRQRFWRPLYYHYTTPAIKIITSKTRDNIILFLHFLMHSMFFTKLTMLSHF